MEVPTALLYQLVCFLFFLRHAVKWGHSCAAKTKKLNYVFAALVLQIKVLQEILSCRLLIACNRHWKVLFRIIESRFLLAAIGLHPFIRSNLMVVGVTFVSIAGGAMCVSSVLRNFSKVSVAPDVFLLVLLRTEIPDLQKSYWLQLRKILSNPNKVTNCKFWWLDKWVRL